MSAALRYTVDVSGWAQPMREAASRAEDLTPAHRVIGELVLDRTTTNFANEAGPDGPWPALSIATLIQRARGRSGRAQVFADKVIERPSKQGTKSLGGRALTKRAQNVIEGAKELVFSGRLLRSLHSLATATYAEVGSNLVYAARQFFGWTETQPHTPARNPFHLTDADESSILRIYTDYLFGGLR